MGGSFISKDDVEKLAKGFQMGDGLESLSKSKAKKIFLAVIIIIAVLAIAFAAYVGKYYHATVDVDNYVGHNNDAVTVSAIGQDVGEGQYVDGLFLDGSGTEDLVIFYQGAKVEYTAYLPLLYDLAANGVDCYLVEMPYNLAFFGMDLAGQVMEQTDGSYENYYLMGHSLGGAMGASFAAEDIQASDRLKGIIFLASYPTKSLDKEGFKVLSVYGSEDLVLNMEKVEEGRQYMPADYVEVCIEGGNHAQFGEYGEQEGDGKALVTAVEQRSQTVESILQMLGR